jgi:MFS family permease
MTSLRPPLDGEAGQPGKGRLPLDLKELSRSLRHRDFRYLLAGQVSTSTAMWMEQLARGWLVYEMTGSVFLLGVVQAVRALPLLFLGLFGGVLADRLDRKRQLMVAQLLNMVLNFILATLIVTGLVEIWHVFTTAFLAGSVMAFQQPARQSLLPNTVPRSDLVNAVGLNSIALNGSHALGPAIAGVMVAFAGLGFAYYFQGLLFLGASFWTAQLKVGGGHRHGHAEGKSILGSLAEGLRYIRGNQAVFMLLILALLPIVFALPVIALLPAFADLYQAGPGGLGLLLGANGVGSVIGAFVVASAGDFHRKGLYLLIVIMVLGLSVAAFALSPWLWVAVLMIGLAGFSQTGYRVLNQTLLHTNTEDRYRGRVMSVYLLDRGVAPLGALLAGTMAALMGAPSAVAVLGALTFLTAAVVAAAVPPLRRLS